MTEQAISDRKGSVRFRCNHQMPPTRDLLPPAATRPLKLPTLFQNNSPSWGPSTQHTSLWAHFIFRAYQVKEKREDRHIPLATSKLTQEHLDAVDLLGKRAKNILGP